MKKVFNKIPKKVKYTIVAILLLVLIIADAKCSQSFKGQEHKKGTVDTISVIESEQPAPEPSLESFEELQDDYEKDGNDSSTTIEEIDDTINSTYEDTEEENQDSGSGEASRKRSKVSGTEDSVGANKGKTVIIDESKETMKEETGNSEEKEYDANQEPQGKIDWNITPKPEKKGSEKQITLKPGGKQRVGYW